MDKLGDWDLNVVHRTDCSTGLRKIPSNTIDIAITSPPYWGQRGDHGLGAISDPRHYVTELVGILSEVMRTLKPSGLLWLNVGDAYNTPINWRLDDLKYSTLGAERNGLDPRNSAYTKNRGKRRAFVDKEVPWLTYGNLLALPYRIVLGLCDQGMLFRGEVLWAKQKAMPEGRCRRPHRKHESIYIIAKSERHLFRTTPPVSSVWILKPDGNQKAVHYSTFPLDLPLTCIRSSGLETGTILDPFMGSGTTGLAAQMLGFDFLGFELDGEYAQIANKRISTASYTTTLDLEG